MDIRNKAIALVVLTMAMLALGSCGVKEKNTPSDVVGKYIKSARDGDAKGLFEAGFFIIGDYEENLKTKWYEDKTKNGDMDKMLERGFEDCGDIDTYEIDSVGEVEDYDVSFDKSTYKSRKVIITANTLEDSRKMVFTLVLDRQGYWVVRELQNPKE